VGVVELGRYRVELAAELVDDADRDQIDQAAVLDEFTVVEIAVHHCGSILAHG
jgi:hypothetical protein